MEEFSFKSLALTGILLGLGAWIFTGSGSSKADRKLDAVESLQAKVKGPNVYKPDIPSSGGRDEEAGEVRVDPDTSSGTANVEANGQTEPELVAVPAKDEGSEFMKTREEIGSILAQGDVEGALEVAERKLEESIKDQNPEIAYIGYLHEFIMQNSEEDQVEVDATLSALRGIDDKNVRKHIYEKFQTYSPQLVEELDRELGDNGIDLN